MDIVTALISLISGAAGGNATGAVAPDKSLGTLGNSVAGLLGGGLGGYLMQAMDLLGKAGVLPTGAEGVAHAAPAFDIGSLIANVAGSGVGGALLTFVVGLIKNSMNNKA